jgi:hypothetical protein
MSLKTSLAGIGRAFDKPEQWFLRGVMAASAIAVVYYAGDKAKDAPTMAIYILLGLAVVGFHVSGAKKLCKSWFERRPVALLGWLLVVVFCAAWEGNSQLTIASANPGNLSTIPRTAFVKSETAEHEVNRIAGQLLAKQNEAAWKTDVGPIGAIQAKIDAAKADRRFEATNGCTVDIKGKKLTEFCNGYRQATADKAMAARRMVLDEEINGLNDKLAAARASRTSGPALASAARSDFGALKKLTSMTEEDLEIGQSVMLWLMMSALLTIAGILVTSEEFEGKPRKPWFTFSIARLAASIRKAWDGTDHTVFVYRTRTMVRNGDTWVPAVS